jgi:polyphosphate kinase
MSSYTFFDRDISWLSFNERVLLEAANPSVPLMERFRFLSIYSSNLDEFYRVRMSALMAIQAIDDEKKSVEIYQYATELISRQLEMYGVILNEKLIPELADDDIILINDGLIPDEIQELLTSYFFTHVAGLLQPILLKPGLDYFPENNLLYLAVITQQGDTEQLYLVNIPCEQLPRFYSLQQAGKQFIIYLEDIVAQNIKYLFEGNVIGAFNIKITRDAELEVQDEFEEDLAEKIEKQLKKRDKGFATRFLYQPGFPLRQLQHIIEVFSLQKASVVAGGRHHNLRDLAALPISGGKFNYPSWPARQLPNNFLPATRLLDQLGEKDMIVHTPYMSYDTIIRFFNEAAIDDDVAEIQTTLYRIALQSRIAQALISAAKNGKKVTVLVELKARFDEANNIHWAKRMKAAGVRIIYSDSALKVHAKVALVKREKNKKPFVGLFATGNLNESTARFYTDHILMTSRQEMLVELDQLFSFLAMQKKPAGEQIAFKHLLVAQFNLQQVFLQLIDREVKHAQEGKPASIIIKINNLEEEVLINKLYEASNAGVTIQMIVRSICRLVPGVRGQSEKISVKRIVDRYLEHGRVFIFHNAGNEEVFMGSADWMNRNMYRRIEVCFPVYDDSIRHEMIQLVRLQLNDNINAVMIDSALQNVPIAMNAHHVRSQEAIYNLLHS